MAGNSNQSPFSQIELPRANTDELKSNQSVRATFRLSKNTILALHIVSNQLGIKQKSVFDHLIADTKALETIARELKKTKATHSEGIQKTYVISRKTLSILQRMEKAHSASRNALVEYSIQRLKPIIEQEKSKLMTRKKITMKIKSLLDSQKALLDEAIEHLGEEDPICEQLSSAITRLENAFLAVSDFVKRGEKLTAINV